MFESILVANRGEIAVRVIRACRELGIRSVAVYSDADAGALHVRLADEAARIGDAQPARSYLDANAILAAAKEHGVEAVHPGYGLLSENAEFAAAVAADGITFIGPPPRIIAEMGDKVAARAVAQRAGVPVLPGTAPLADDQDAAAEAARIGYPLLVKASFGGGGRGMRVVHEPAELADALAGAGRDAASAFGRAEVFLERCLPRPRHVEVQILADRHGTVCQLGDRDCSVQRRHQKLLEEAPAPGLDDAVRARLTGSAVNLARAVGYVGAGTVEFLLDPHAAEFYFLEMNTRLQVEHGVTELVSGVDLVQAQIRIAAGEPLHLGDDALTRGHAIEARLTAEDVYEGFRPAPGTVRALRLPAGPWLRADFGVEAGDAVASEYDSLFGKLLAWGPDRETARRRLAAALGELRVSGFPHSGDYLRGVLDRPEFRAVTHDTGSVTRDWPPDPAQRAVEPAAPARGAREREVVLHTDQGPVRVAVYGHGDAGGVAPRPARGPLAQHAQRPAGAEEPAAPMAATVVKVLVTSGARVADGDVLVVLEAMKMEFEVRARRGGTVREVLVSAGESVSAGTLLVAVE